MNDDETVAQVCEVLYAYPKAEVCNGNGLTVLNNDKIADRILAAHRREVAELKRELELTRQQRNRARLDMQEKFMHEVAELRECLKEAVVYFCGNDKLADCIEKVYGNPKCETEGHHCMVERWRKKI